jgi:hypothetical protein
MEQFFPTFRYGLAGINPKSVQITIIAKFLDFVVEGFIPSWKDSSAKQYWFEINVIGNRRVVVAPPGGDKPHPYKQNST